MHVCLPAGARVHACTHTPLEPLKDQASSLQMYEWLYILSLFSDTFRCYLLQHQKQNQAEDSMCYVAFNPDIEYSGRPVQVSEMGYHPALVTKSTKTKQYQLVCNGSVLILTRL